MRPFFSRIIKPWLALTAAAIIAGASQQACTQEAVAKAPEGPAAVEAGRREKGVHVVELAVTEKGFEPGAVKLKKGEPVKLVVTRKTDVTCATELVMEEYKIDAKLPLNTPVEIAFTPSQGGTLRYGCAMGKMIAGTFVVE